MGKRRLSDDGTAKAGSPGRNGKSASSRPHASAPAAGGPEAPDTEMGEKPTRCRFTAEYKLSILRQADQCTKPGQLGALLTREGLYWSHLSSWRRQREQGMLAALTPRKRSRKTDGQNHLVDEIRSLRRENEHLRARLDQAEMIIEMEAKVSEFLADPLETLESEEANL